MSLSPDTRAAPQGRRVRSYARGGGLLAKTDRIDAKLLALFAQREQPTPFCFKPELPYQPASPPAGLR